MNKLSSITPLMPWLSLVGIILLQSTSNTISNFPAYSAQLIQLLSISSLQLNGLIVASEFGKLFDCVCILSLRHLPLWLMLSIGMVLGSVSYVVQLLFLLNKITHLSYWHLLVLQVLAGNSICWFNTVCSQTAQSNFLGDYQSVVALTTTYSGLSGKLYTLLVEAVHEPGSKDASATYLILNCLVPICVGLVFISIVRDPPREPIKRIGRGSFLFVFVLAATIGGCAVFDSVAPEVQRMSPTFRVVILLVLIVLPVVVPIGMALQKLKLEKWTSETSPNEGIATQTSEEIFIHIDDREVNKNEREESGGLEEKDLEVKEVLLGMNFWLYFMVYACGATLIMAYFNNFGRISKSRVQSDAPILLAISSSFGFFARLFTVLFERFARGKNVLSRPVTMAVLMAPMTGSFFILVLPDNHYLYVSTAILGICSGILNTIAGLVTSDLFGSKNSGMIHRIVLANIPLGALLYGSLAAIEYDSEGDGSTCTGFKCFNTTFIIWGSICLLGTFLSVILYLRTRKIYTRR